MSWSKWQADLNDPLRFRWLIVGICGITYFFCWMHRVSTTVIARDLVLEFDADATVLGLMSSSYFYLYAAAQPAVGLLSDTLGPRRVITFCMFLTCVGSVVFGTASNMAMATVGRALIGAGAGGAFVPALKVFSKWYATREFPGVVGIFQAMGNTGALSSSLPLTYLVLLLGWRVSFLTIGAFSLFLTITCWMAVRDKPEDKGWRPIEGGENPSRFNLPKLPENIQTSKRLTIVLNNPRFWMVTTSLFFLGVSTLTFQGLWAVPYLMDVHGYSRVQTGEWIMIIPIGAIIGAPMVGFLAGKFGHHHKGILLCCLGLGLGSWATFLLSGSKPRPVYLFPLFLMLGFSSGGSVLLYMTIVKELFPPWITGTAVGLANPAAFIGAAVSQPFTGFLMDMVGRSGSVYPLEAYSYVFITFFVSGAIAIIPLVPLALPGMPTQNTS